VLTPAQVSVCLASPCPPSSIHATPQDDDDLYVIEYARSKDTAASPAFVVSNDMYRDHMQSYNSDAAFAEWLRSRLISYSFVADDDFMPNPGAMARLRQAAAPAGSISDAPAASAYNQQYPAVAAAATSGHGSGAGPHVPATAATSAGPAAPRRAGRRRGTVQSSVHLPDSGVEESDDEEDERGRSAGSRQGGASRHVLGSLEMSPRANRRDEGHSAANSAPRTSFYVAHAAMVRGMALVTSSPTYAGEVGPLVMSHRLQLTNGHMLGGAMPLHNIILAHLPALTGACLQGQGAVQGGSSGPTVPAPAAGSGPTVPSSTAGPAAASATSAGGGISAADLCQRVMSRLPGALGQGSRARASAALVRDGVGALGVELHGLTDSAMREAGLQQLVGNAAAASVFAAAATEQAMADWMAALGSDAQARSAVYSHVLMLKVAGEQAGTVAELNPAVLAATITQVPQGGWQRWVWGGDAGQARRLSSLQAGVQAVKAAL